MISAVNFIFLFLSHLFSLVSLIFSTFFNPPEQRADGDGCVFLTQKALSFGKLNLLDVCLRDHMHVPEEASCKNNRAILLHNCRVRVPSFE